MVRKLFNWIFKVELNKLKSEIVKAENLITTLDKQRKVFDNVLSNIDVSVDIHEYDHRYSPSWAVISLQGQKTDYIKFIALGQSDINEIANFLRQFERNTNIKVDASPHATRFLRITQNHKH